MFDAHKRIIWITGASTGIGRSLAEALAKEGHKLIVSARSESALATLKEQYPDNVIAMVLDVNDPNAQNHAQKQIEETFGYIDVCVHAAGICEYLNAKHFDAELVERVFNTNVMGAVRTIQTALTLFRQSPRKNAFKPYLVVVSSSIAWVPVPRAEAYGASKAALTYFCESLKADLHAEEIDVSVVSPGFVKTPMTDKNDFEMPMLISSEEAAKAIVEGMGRRDWDIHFPKGFTRLLLSIRLLPSTLRQRLTRTLSRHQKTANHQNANAASE